MAHLTAPNGAVVNVSDEKVQTLLSRGFTQPESAKKAAPAKSAAKKTPSK